MRTKKILAFLAVAIFLVSLAAWARFEVDNSGRPFFDGLILGGSTPLKFEGNTVNGIATTFQITDPSVDRTFTFPNASMIIAGQDVNNSFSAAQTISSASPQLTLSNTGTATFGVDTGGVLTVDPSGGDVNIASGDNLTVNGSGMLGMGAGSTGHINLGGSGNIKLNSNYVSGDGDDEGIYIDDSGNVGIGTTVPGRSLEIKANSAYEKFNSTSEDWTIGADSNGFVFINDTDSATRLYIGNGGNVGVADATPDATLDVAGNIGSDNFEIIRSSNYVAGEAITGTASTTNGSATVTGSSTSFTTELAVNDWIKVGTNGWRQVSTITNNTSLTVTSNMTVTASSQTILQGPRKDVAQYWSIPLANLPSFYNSANTVIVPWVTNNLNDYYFCQPKVDQVSWSGADNELHVRMTTLSNAGFQCETSSSATTYVYLAFLDFYVPTTNNNVGTISRNQP